MAHWDLRAAVAVVTVAEELLGAAPAVLEAPQRLLRLLQIRVAAEAVVVIIRPAELAAQVFAACGGLNKENNDELCTYQ